MNAICDTLPINKQAHTIIEDAFEKKIERYSTLFCSDGSME